MMRTVPKALWALPVLAAAMTVLASAGSALAADAASGEKIYKKKCKTCHSLEAGKNKIGPSLAGVMGRTAGTLEGFKFSKPMIESGLVWDEATLDAFLAKPKELVPKTKMAFPGMKKEEDRQDVIAYIKEAAQ